MTEYEKAVRRKLTKQGLSKKKVESELNKIIGKSNMDEEKKVDEQESASNTPDVGDFGDVELPPVPENSGLGLPPVRPEDIGDSQNEDESGDGEKNVGSV